METLLDYLQLIFLALYLIVFVFSLYKFPEYKDSALKYLPLIFFFTLATEYVGYFIRDDFNNINNFSHNFYYLLHFSFFFYVFKEMIDNDRFKKNIKIGIVVFWLFFLSDIVFTDIFNDSFTRTYIAGAGIMVFCIIQYYISILQSSLVLVVKNDLLFWISVGLFLFYIGYLPIKIIRTWFYNFNSFYELLQLIQFSLIIIMYLCFLTGFLWMKKRS